MSKINERCRDGVESNVNVQLNGTRHVNIDFVSHSFGHDDIDRIGVDGCSVSVIALIE